MTISLIYKVSILLLLAMIMVSLGSGLVFLVRDGGRTKRVITSLSVRIALSIVLFLLLIVGYFAGYIEPHGIPPVRIDKSAE